MCPANLTGKPLKPRSIIVNERDQAYDMAEHLVAVGKLKAQGRDKEAAAAVGKAVAERAVEAGVKEVAFDRSGFRYHGRVKVLADAAREVGLEF